MEVNVPNDERLPIIQYWHEEELPEYVSDLHATFRDLNPELRPLLFCEATAEKFIAEHFTHREVRAFRSCVVPSMQSDYLRFCSILALGGFYSDIDFRCIAPLQPLFPKAGCGRLFNGPKGNVISGFFGFGSAGHPFLELALEIATVNIERRYPDTVYFVAGPPIFTSLVGMHRHGSFDGLAVRFPEPPMREFIESYCHTVGDYGRIEVALAGIEIGTPNEYRNFLGSEGALPYKSTEMHWTNVKGDIFRDP